MCIPLSLLHIFSHSYLIFLGSYSLVVQKLIIVVTRLLKLMKAMPLYGGIIIQG